MDKSALPLAEVLDDPEEIDRRYAEFERQEAQKKIDRLGEIERLKEVARRKERLQFDPGIAAEICERIAEGEVLKAVCASREDFPSPRQARRWLRGNEAFAAEYAKACEERLAAWEDEIVLIADDASRDKVEKRTARGLVLETDSAAVSRSKLQVDARKALLRANNPAKWGEAIAVVNPEQSDPFANMSLDRIDAIVAAADLDELQKRRDLDKENAVRALSGEPPLDFTAFVARKSRC
jgi:hypothetical protein